MMSATYRRGSQGDAASWKRDLENKWLARGPRVRLPAETLRNQTLTAAGLLTERLGGPSVKPYQPDGLWQEIATDTNYDQSHGAELYRRGLYTYWKRTVVPPMMSVFDSSSREMCVVRQATTNTPLQALATLNEVTFVEASRALAVRAIQNADTPDARLRLMFRLVLARVPAESEMAILQNGLARHRSHYAQHRKQAMELLKAGELEHSADIDIGELAAYATMANLILNLDEAITKD